VKALYKYLLTLLALPGEPRFERRVSDIN